jgi:pentatricopeptide repeat protein
MVERGHNKGKKKKKKKIYHDKGNFKGGHMTPPPQIRPCFPFLLKSLSDFRDLKQGQCLHTHVIKLGHLNDIYVQNSLLDLYASCGHMGLCRRVFDEMPQRDVVSWTVLIMGYKNAGEYDDALIFLNNCNMRAWCRIMLLWSMR